MIPKRDKETDISSEVAQGKMFRKRLMNTVQTVTDRFMKGESMNDVIAELAQKENFTQVQIQRLVEESNTIGYNKRYDEVKKSKDRRITFELAELKKVLEVMGSNAPAKVDNPNWVSGKSGDGVMNKVASTIETSYFHNPNSRLDEKRAKLAEKNELLEKKAAAKESLRAEREIESNIFGIANSLVMTERLYKTANTIFNTMLSDVEMEDDVIERIEKRANEISEHLVNTGRAQSNFMVSLKVNPIDKIANTVLGEHSLLNTHHDTKVETPKVAPTSSVAQYQQLVELAKAIQQSQTMNPISQPNNPSIEGAL